MTREEQRKKWQDIDDYWLEQREGIDPNSEVGKKINEDFGK